MSTRFFDHLRTETESLHAAGLYKAERVITSHQGAAITVGQDGGQEVLNLCANNYLGLADSPELVAAAHAALGPLRLRHGLGALHLRHPGGAQGAGGADLSAFFGAEDTILYSSCFDANTGLFETVLGPEDAIISDALNHASIIDGVRLCKAKRLRYANNDMAELEARLKEAQDCRFRMIATDGVFSMDGVIADLPAICDLAERYDALVMVDDSHAVGVHGPGRPRHAGALRRGRPDRAAHRHPGQGPGRRLRRLHQRPGARSWNGCASARGPTCSPTPSPR